MRRKQLAKRVAIAVLSAATVMTSVPATAVFAAETSVEASDTKAEESTTTVTVVANTDGDEDGADAVKAALVNGHVVPNLGTDGKTYTLEAVGESSNTLQQKIESALGTDYTVDNLKLTDATKGDFSFTATKNADNASYTVTVTATPDASKDLPDGEVKSELDYYFANKTFDAYDGKSLTGAYIADQAKKDILADTKSTYPTLTAAKTDLSITGTSAVVGSDGTVALKVKYAAKGQTYDYTATVKVENKEGTKDAAVKAAVATLNGKTYAFNNEGVVEGKLVADLKAAGVTDATTGEGAAHSLVKVSTTYPSAADVAKRDRTVIYRVGPESDGNSFTITLTKSSKQKLQETENAIYKAGDNAGSAAGFLAGAAAEAAKNVAIDSKTTKSLHVYKFGDNTVVSLNTQALHATKAATEADAVKAVQNAVDAALTKAKVADNGVKVTVEAVDETIAANSELKAKAATSTANGKGSYYVLIKADIADDFKDWTNVNAEDKTGAPVYYLVNVETKALDLVEATDLTFADQTVIYKANAYNSQKTPYMAIDLKAALTPEDSNAAVTYELKTTTSNAVLGSASTKGFFKKADLSDDADRSNNILYVKAPGEYKVEASVATKDGTTVTKEATITVKGNFADVTTGAYYEKAVQQAYAADIAQGIGNNQFDPNGDVTRGQFVTFLYRYAVKADPSVEIKDADVKEIFSDVPTTSYYAKAVQWASANKIALGTGDGKFDPDAKVTRGQAVTFIYRAKSNPDTGASGAQYENTTRFTDLTAGSYYVAPVTWGVNNSVVSGLSTTEFGPEQTASRAQAITFIARAYTDNGNGIFTGIDKAANR